MGTHQSCTKALVFGLQLVNLSLHAHQLSTPILVILPILTLDRFSRKPCLQRALQWPKCEKCVRPRTRSLMPFTLRISQPHLSATDWCLLPSRLNSIVPLTVAVWVVEESIHPAISPEWCRFGVVEII